MQGVLLVRRVAMPCLFPFLVVKYIYISVSYNWMSLMAQRLLCIRAEKKEPEMLGIRQKLSLGFCGLLLIIVVIGTQSISQLTTLEHSIDVILRENYQSVMASGQMKEALERMDSGALFVLLGDTAQGVDQIAANESLFETALGNELNNITVPGEREKAFAVRELFDRYREVLTRVQDPGLSLDLRRHTYRSELLPLFQRIHDTAEEILHMNQENMIDANVRARATAASAKRRMHILLLCGAVVSGLFVLFTGKWILRPINRLIRSTDDIRRGNLDLVVQSDSRDEIGRLSEAFNEMASSLREFRRFDRTRMALIQRSTGQLFKSLPEVVAVLDRAGRVEVSTRPASEIFGLKPDVGIRSLPHAWIAEYFDKALKTGLDVEHRGRQQIIQEFSRGEERFFSPKAVPILDVEKQPIGVLLVLKDVTQQFHQDELKRGVISTVSHQLKTPLTSLRMAVYLLLEEKVGPLNPKQTDLLLAARDESDRLHSILGNLLDISRIESGKAGMDFLPLSPHAIVFEQEEAFQSAAKDRGIILKTDLPGDLPEVLADHSRIGHVFANLISNAIKYTSPGGTILVSARSGDDQVTFSVSDTGRGIPGQYLDRVFEQFFRIPGYEGEGGEGLGLAIAREIVVAHGGSITVESEEGKGSTFHFTLNRAGGAGSKVEPMDATLRGDA